MRGKANWKKLRVAHKVGAALKSVNEENRLLGVTNDNDDNTDWAQLHKQDLSKKPNYIIVPNGSFRTGWDMYVGLLLLYVAAFVPYRVTFLQDLDSFWQIIEVRSREKQKQKHYVRVSPSYITNNKGACFARALLFAALG